MYLSSVLEKIINLFPNASPSHLVIITAKKGTRTTQKVKQMQSQTPPVCATVPPKTPDAKANTWSRENDKRDLCLGSMACINF